VERDPDGDTCAAGCEPRVQRCNRQERESAQVYKEFLTDFWGTLFRTLRFTAHGSLSFDILSEYLVIPSLSERDRPQWRHSVFYRFLRRIEVWRTEANVVRSWSRMRNLWRGKTLALRSTGRITFEKWFLDYVIRKLIINFKKDF